MAITLYVFEKFQEVLICCPPSDVRWCISVSLSGIIVDQASRCHRPCRMAMHAMTLWLCHDKAVCYLQMRTYGIRAVEGDDEAQPEEPFLLQP